MSLRPFFPYYGSKWLLAPRYEAPRFDRIVEPFAGGAGYSLRYPSRDVVLCDLDPIICALWRYLIGASRKEILALPLMELGQSTDDLSVCQEAKWLIGFWLNPASANGGNKTLSKWSRQNLIERPGSVWSARTRSRIARQVPAIRHWTVIEGNYADLDVSEPATWFVDPPYQAAGRHYRKGSKDIDFAHLGAWCRSLPGQVAVCENDGADWLPFEPVHSGRSQVKGRKSAEVVYLQGASQQTLWGDHG